MKKPFWYQLYVFHDRGFAAIDDRARQGGELLGDVPHRRPADRGQRHADIKNGLTVPPRLTMRNAWDMTTKGAGGRA